MSISGEELLVDRAQLLTLTAPEMEAFVGGLRVRNANFGQSQHGVFTRHPGMFTNDFLVNLLDVNPTWNATLEDKDLFEGHDRATGRLKWIGTRSTLFSVRTPSYGHWQKFRHVRTFGISFRTTLRRQGTR